MFDPQDSNLKKFLKSPYHWWLLGLTLGVGFISAHPLVMLAGLALYVVGWIHLPDSAMFQGWVTRHMDAIASAKSRAQIQAFKDRRQSLISSLSPQRMRRYMDVAAVCQDIERATVDGGPSAATDADPRLRKLDELMWTFLRLLVMEGSLESFLETESEEKLPVDIQSSQTEIAALEGDIKAATAKGENTAAKLRLLDSKKERLAVLSKRQERVSEATENVTLVRAEQDRLVEQIKLLRADAIAARNADTLTARIDATVEHLTETNKLFSEMDQFKDLVADDMPQTGERLGFSAAAARTTAPPEMTPPPHHQPAAPREPVSTKQPQLGDF
jgi:hypothetical protein